MGKLRKRRLSSSKSPKFLGYARSAATSVTVRVSPSAEHVAVPSTKPIDLRFSPFRNVKLVRNLEEDQKGFIARSEFHCFLEANKCVVPIDFLEWIIMHTCPSSSEIIVGYKRIAITKGMVNRALGIPRGKLPVVTSSTDADTNSLVNDMKTNYLDVDKKYCMRKCVSLLLEEHDEVSFMRSFMLLLISSIFVPRKDDLCAVEYLHSLVDISQIASYDWAQLILGVVLSEVNRYQRLKETLDAGNDVKIHYIEGCIPLLAVQNFSKVCVDAAVLSTPFSYPEISPDVYSKQINLAMLMTSGS